MNVISTGLLSLDVALGVGGWPQGSLIEIFGPPDSAKTTLGLLSCATAQARGLSAAFVDVDCALDRAYAIHCGVDADRLLISQPADGDEALGIATLLAKSGAAGLIVLDSVAALNPAETGRGLAGGRQNPDSGQPARSQQRLLEQGLRSLHDAARFGRTVVLLTNQLRQKIHPAAGGSQTTPGGFSINLLPDIRIELTPGWPRTFGRRVQAALVKNKWGRRRECAFWVSPQGGISLVDDALDIGLACQAVEQRGAAYWFTGQSLGMGRIAALERLRQDKALFDDLRAAIRRRCLPPPPVKLRTE